MNKAITLTQEQERQYHTDGICRIIEIKEHLIQNNIREALLKHAPFKALGYSEQYPSSVFADAYVSAIKSGDLEPVVFNEEYNDMVRRKEREAIARRLKGDSWVYAANGEPFKKEKSALECQTTYDLEATHQITAIDGGYALKQRTPSQIKDYLDKQAGILSYGDLQKQVFFEMGIEYKENEDGELDATEEQWVLIDQRVNELQHAQHHKKTATA